MKTSLYAKNPNLVNVTSIIPDIHVDLKYATTGLSPQVSVKFEI